MSGPAPILPAMALPAKHLAAGKCRQATSDFPRCLSVAIVAPMPDAAPADHRNALKREAALAALKRVRSGMIVGLGSGSTAALFIEELGQCLATGQLTDIQGIPTSEPSRGLAEKAGIPLIDWKGARRCQVVVDGADEVDPQLQLIKGLGGALLREKVVAQNSDYRVIIADESKRVSKLGVKAPLPVEVLPFGHETQPDFFRGLGGEPVLRLGEDATAFITDNGNYIYDVAFGPIADPAALEHELLVRAGVIQTGLFLGLADEVIIATGDRIDTLTRA